MTLTRGQTPEQPPVEAFAHHGITVVDLERSIEFFEGVLGFTRHPRVDLDETFSEGVTGIDGVRISVVFLEGPGLHVELLQYDGAPRRGGAAPRPCDPGSAHLALYVADVEDVVARSVGSGWSLSGVVQPITTGPRAGGRAAYLHDEAGAVVELVERPTPQRQHNVGEGR